MSSDVLEDTCVVRDTRKPLPLGCYSESHHDDITQVCVFSPVLSYVTQCITLPILPDFLQTELSFKSYLKWIILKFLIEADTGDNNFNKPSGGRTT